MAATATRSWPVTSPTTGMVAPPGRYRRALIAGRTRSARGGAGARRIVLQVTRTTGTAAPWWTVPPAYQVSWLVGVDRELLDVAVDPLPPAAPAIVRFRSAAGLSPADQVTVLLDELDRAALALFPGWLPGAERLDGPHPLGVAAVRTLAGRAAARSPAFGPFLADLAERGLRGPATGPAAPHARTRSRFPAEVRAAGLARVLADAYGRSSLAVLLDVPDRSAAADERNLVAVAEWLATHGRCAVWLAGAAPRTVDRIRRVAVELPVWLTELAGAPDPAPEPGGERAGPRPGTAGPGRADVPEPPPLLRLPPLSGRPRRDSAAEQALERALAPHEWARGRRWNHVHEWHTLARPYRLDLFWAAEGLAVEVDGPEHRGRIQFADDRRRDVQLQLLGHAVLRFTNEQVLSDVHAVVLAIRHLLVARRAAGTHDGETRHDVDR